MRFYEISPLSLEVKFNAKKEIINEVPLPPDWDKDFAGVHHVPTGRFENMLMSMWDVESTVWFDITDLENLGEVEIDL